MVWERLPTGGTSVWHELADLRDGDIDIREFINECLNKHGHEVFVRSPTEQRCSCFDPNDAFREFDPRCPDCQGFGYFYRDVLETAYRRPAFGTFGFTGAAQRVEVGTVGMADHVWYFRHTATPVVGHHVVECTTDDEGKIKTNPKHIERVHQILLAHLYREKLGRPEYWAVLTRESHLGK